MRGLPRGETAADDSEALKSRHAIRGAKIQRQASTYWSYFMCRHSVAPVDFEDKDCAALHWLLAFRLPKCTACMVRKAECVGQHVTPVYRQSRMQAS